MSLLHSGRITPRGEPILQIKIVGAPDPIDALVDTGFNRSVLIFETERRLAGLPPTKERTLEIQQADMQAPAVHVYRSFGVVLFGKQSVHVDFVVFDMERPNYGKCKIGIELLQEFEKFCLNFRDNKVLVY